MEPSLTMGRAGQGSLLHRLWNRPLSVLNGSGYAPTEYAHQKGQSSQPALWKVVYSGPSLPAKTDPYPLPRWTAAPGLLYCSHCN